MMNFNDLVTCLDTVKELENDPASLLRACHQLNRDSRRLEVELDALEREYRALSDDLPQVNAGKRLDTILEEHERLKALRLEHEHRFTALNIAISRCFCLF